ncbi:4'-phosphopantetheinyl transferase family protein [Methylobacterium sp. JK268]
MTDGGQGEGVFAPLRLAPGEAAARVVRADAVLAGLPPERRALPDDEAARIARFRQPGDRHEREAGHGLMRHLLAAEIGAAPGEIVLLRDAHGRPRLPGAPDLDLNLSHGAGWVAVAIARGGRVGVDVEGASRPVEWDRLVTQFLHPAEITAYRALPPALRPARALELWSVKEACLKASGEGLAAEPRRLRLDADGAGWILSHRGLRLRAWSRVLADGARFAWAGEEGLRWRVVAGAA